MNDEKEIIYRPTYHSTQHTRKLIKSSRRQKRLYTSIIERSIELGANVAIASLLLSSFSGIAAMGCWGLKIIHTTNPDIIVSRWHYSKRIYFGSAVVSFSSFLAASLAAAALSTCREK